MRFKWPGDVGQTTKRGRQILLLVSGLVLGTSVTLAAADDSTTCMAGAPEIAIAACTRIISAGTTSSTSELVLVYSFRGLQFERMKEFGKAIADFDRAIQLDPKNAVPYGGRGTVYLEQGELDRAISAFSEAIRLGPKQANATATDYSLRGDAYTRKGQYDRALRDYNSALKINPTYDVAFAGRGQAYFQIGDYDRAIEDFGTAIRLDPNDPNPHLIRGRSYAKKGEYDRAIIDLTSAIDLKHPRLAFAYLVRADAYEGRGDLQKALADYRMAMDRDPELKEAGFGIRRINQRLAATNESTSSKLQSTGSGFVINRVGNIVTNHHVIEGCSKVQVRWSAGVMRASIVGNDETNDLAILRSEIDELRPLAFRDGRVIRQADPVVSIGFPLTGLLATSAKVSIGAVSALAGLDDDTRFLEISAPIQPGNSGGPLLDFSGNVVGVVVSTLNASAMLKNTGSIPQNVNFAIKSNIVREFLDAKGITYDAATSSTKLEAADVAERGVRSTVLVECYR
jgi:S1-C subfamily serine protease/lipoprotein NlpI